MNDANIVSAKAARAAIVTLSFRGDYEICRLLCESVDRFADPAIEHVLAVPQSDRALFSGLASSRRRIIAQEALLPGWLFKIPLPSPKWRKRLRLPRRNMYLSLRGKPVRGWIAQQIMKLSVGSVTDAEIIVHADSDAAFVRPFTSESFLIDDFPRYLREPGAGESPMHAVWHRAASRLLGLPEKDYHGADYIEGVNVWTRENLEKLKTHIAAQTGMDWRLALTRNGDFSEYVLYGVFLDAIPGESRRQTGTAQRLCSWIWEPLEGPASDAPIDIDIAPHELAIGIQSTIPLSLELRKTTIMRAIEKANRFSESAN